MMRRGAVALLVALSACAPHHRVLERSDILAKLSARLGTVWHECVPLGWQPMPAGGSYYPGFTAHSLGSGWWLPPMWAVSIADSRRGKPDVNAVTTVLDELVQKGLLSRERLGNAYDYHLTFRAFPYFYTGDDYGDNVEGWPYLCYSTVHPTRVRWVQQVHPERVSGAMHQVYRAEFEWSAGTPADWADDRVIRSHSVVLAPVSTPAVAKFVNWDGEWQISGIYAPGTMLPALARVRW